MAVSQIYAKSLPESAPESNADAGFMDNLTPTVREARQVPVVPAAYQYQYEVSDPEGNNFYGHGEKRDGDIISGSYFTLLPDGRRQRVDYTVSAATGYVATVTYN